MSRMLRLAAIAIAVTGLSATACKPRTETADVLSDGAGGAAVDAEAARLYDAVVAELSAKHGAAKGQTWEETSGDFSSNWLMQSPEKRVWSLKSPDVPYGAPCETGADCDADFKLKICANDSACGGTGSCQPFQASVKAPGQQPVKMCVGYGDVVVERLYESLIKAKQSINIASLSPPDGRYRAAIVNALVYLDNAGAKPDVRMLYGGETSMSPTRSTPEEYLQTWLTDLKARKADFSLPLSCAWMSYLTSWNHSKIVTIDDQEAIVGSMNFWQRVYLQPSPVFDMSLNVKGAAAAAAARFFDTMWNSKYAKVGSQPPGLPVRRNPPPEGAGNGRSKMISAGRLGKIGDNAADTAIDALIRNAKKSVMISQQDLYSIMMLWGNPFGLDALTEAIINDVDVYILKSSIHASFGYGMVSPQKSFHYIARAVEKKAGQYSMWRKKGTYWGKVCDHLHFASLKFSPANPPDGQVKNHTKLIIVDDAAFYLSSQNLYPADLQEHGFLVFDRAVTGQMLAEYWDPAWKHSSEALVPCTRADTGAEQQAAEPSAPPTGAEQDDTHPTLDDAPTATSDPSAAASAAATPATGSAKPAASSGDTPYNETDPRFKTIQCSFQATCTNQATTDFTGEGYPQADGTCMPTLAMRWKCRQACKIPLQVAACMGNYMALPAGTP